MLRTHKSKVGFVIITFLCLSLGKAHVSYAQDGFKTYSAFKDSDKKTLAVVTKDKDYTFRFSHVSLKQALEKIAAEANLTLTYHSVLLDNPAIVDVKAVDVKIEKVLKKVLSRTGLDHKVTRSQHLVIFKKEKIGNIKGKVIDDFSGEPLLHGAKVHLTKGNTSMLAEAKQNYWRTTSIGPEGNYEINNLKPGTYRLFIVQNGTKEIYKKVVIREKETTVEVSRIKYPNKKIEAPELK